MDSREKPTVEVEIHLSGGAKGRVAVPSGAGPEKPLSEWGQEAKGRMRR